VSGIDDIVPRCQESTALRNSLLALRLTFRSILPYNRCLPLPRSRAPHRHPGEQVSPRIL